MMLVEYMVQIIVPKKSEQEVIEPRPQRIFAGMTDNNDPNAISGYCACCGAPNYIFGKGLIHTDECIWYEELGDGSE